MRGGRSGRHGYGTGVDDTCAGGDGDLRLWLLPDTEVMKHTGEKQFYAYEEQVRAFAFRKAQRSLRAFKRRMTSLTLLKENNYGLGE